MNNPSFKTAIISCIVVLTLACGGGNDRPGPRFPTCPLGSVPSTKPAAPRAEYLGESTVAAVFAGARAGESLPPGKVLRIWREPTQNIYVGVDPDSGWGDREVESVWQAIATLDRDFHALFAAVFLESNDGKKEVLARPDKDPWTNKNKVPAFIVIAKEFQSPNKLSIASNYYYLGPGASGVYENVPFIGLNPAVIDGTISNIGPQPIYPGCSPADARAVYMMEGLKDSLLHERVHVLISQFYRHDRLFSELRPDGPQPSCEYDLEELLIKRYLMRHYEARRDLFSEQFFKYWKSDEQALVDKVQKTDCYSRVEKLGLLEGKILKSP